MSKIPRVKEFDGLPVVTAEGMKRLDGKASLEYGIPSLLLMENAGRAIAAETLKFAAEELGLAPAGLKVIACCGRGNNGGDGLVAARHLRRGGVSVKVLILPPKGTGYTELVVKNLRAAKEAGVPVEPVRAEDPDAIRAELSAADLLLDALLGVSAAGEPAGPARAVIQLMNGSGRPVIAVDLPSGLDPDTGRHGGVCITARLTLTLGFAKTGLLPAPARPYTGKIRVLPIGYPQALIDSARG